MSTTVRSDRPVLTDGEIRKRRAESILRVFAQVVEGPIREEERFTTVEWLERCLLAHEIDTLKLAQS